MAGAHRKVSFTLVESIMQRLGYENDVRFSRALGYSDGAVGTWRRRGAAPEVAYLAAKGLLSDHEKREGNAKYHAFLIVLEDRNRVEALEAYIKALGVPSDKVVKL